MRVAIIGCNTAGATAATRLRRARPDWDIVVFERSPYVSFANCGLPYHIGLVVKDRASLFVESAESLRAKHRLDVRVRSEVVAIDRAGKRLRVRDAATGDSRYEGYDKLLIASGAAPLRPAIPGIESEGVMTLWSIADMDRIIERVESGAKKAIIVGAGFLGCILSEALGRRGLSVTVLEAGGQVLDGIDGEIAAYVQAELEANGVALRLGDSVEALRDASDSGRERGLGATLSSGLCVDADFAIFAVGATPGSLVAREAGLEIGESGGIAVGPSQRTSDPDIYAAGDVAESVHGVTGRKTLFQLAGPAQRQARVAADNIAGLESGWDAHYSGVMGSSIARIWNMSVGTAGADPVSLMAAGIPFRSVTIHAPDRAPYFPGSCTVHLKLFFGPDGAVLGAHAAAKDGLARRLDTLATAIRFGANVRDLEDLELAYSPPFGTVRDPVNIAGSVALASLGKSRG